MCSAGPLGLGFTHQVPAGALGSTVTTVCPERKREAPGVAAIEDSGSVDAGAAEGCGRLVGLRVRSSGSCRGVTVHPPVHLSVVTAAGGPVLGLLYLGEEHLAGPCR